MTGDNFYRTGWRPAGGWGCAAGLWVAFVVRPVLPWLVDAARALVQGAALPAFAKPDTMELLMLVGAVLGSSGLRMIEKLRAQG